MEQKPLKVCVVSPLYHASAGGLGKQSQLLTEALGELGVSLFVIARRMKGLPPAVFSENVKVYRAWAILPGRHTFHDVTPVNILISVTFSLSCALLLFRKRKEFDVVHFHGASLPLIIVLPLLKLMRKKIIAKVASANLGIEPGSLRGRYFGLGNLLSRFMRMVDMFVATTSEIEGKLKNEGFALPRIARIPNFIDFKQFYPCEQERKKGLKARIGLAGRPLVTFTGRFIECKGIPSLLNAWKRVVGAIPDARLILVGDGPLLMAMKKASRDIGIAGSIDFPGHTNAVIDYLHASDVYAFPSLQEGMPNALLEAMACGLPVVATRIGGVIDVVRDGESGILAEPGDSQSLAEGIITLLRNSNLAARLGSKAHQLMKESFSLERIAPLYRALYIRLTGPR